MDNSACAGKLQFVKEWFEILQKSGPSDGYFPEPSKSFVIVTSHEMQFAQNLFKDLGHRFIGGGGS